MKTLMNRTIRRLLITSSVCISLAVAAAGSAKAQTPRGQIDLTKLVLMYMAPSGSNHITGWETGSIRGTPILWQHAGIMDCDNVTTNELDVPFCRSGKVVVTVGGSPTHSILGQVVEPGAWNVTLAGGHAGVIYVVIDSDVLSQELNPELLQKAAKIVGSPIRARRIKMCGSFTSGSEQFSVTAPGKAEAFAREWWTCGSGGCQIRITIAPGKEDARYLASCDR